MEIDDHYRFMSSGEVYHQPAAAVRQKLIDIPEEDPQAPSSKIEPSKEPSSDSFHVTKSAKDESTVLGIFEKTVGTKQTLEETRQKKRPNPISSDEEDPRSPSKTQKIPARKILSPKSSISQQKQTLILSVVSNPRDGESSSHPASQDDEATTLRPPSKSPQPVSQDDEAVTLRHPTTPQNAAIQTTSSAPVSQEDLAETLKPPHTTSSSPVSQEDLAETLKPPHTTSSSPVSHEDLAETLKPPHTTSSAPVSQEDLAETLKPPHTTSSAPVSQEDLAETLKPPYTTSSSPVSQEDLAETLKPPPQKKSSSPVSQEDLAETLKPPPQTTSYSPVSQEDLAETLRPPPTLSQSPVAQTAETAPTTSSIPVTAAKTGPTNRSSPVTSAETAPTTSSSPVKSAETVPATPHLPITETPSLGPRITAGQTEGERPVPHPPPPAPSPIVQGSPIPVSIIHGQQLRSRTFSKDGRELKGISSTHTYIQINGVIGNQFLLATTGEPRELAPGEHAGVGLKDGIATLIVEEGGRRFVVSIEISEISDRLLIRQDRLEDAARSGTLDTLLQSKSKKLMNLPKLVADYQKLFDAHFKNNPAGLIGQIEGTPGFDARQMMKVVRAFHRAELATKPQRARDLTPDVKNKYGIQHVRVLYSREGADLKMTRYDVKEELGRGAYGIAYRVAQLDVNEILAAKEVIGGTPEIVQEGRNDLRNEFLLLRQIHSKGKVPGIQEAPHTLIAINGEAGLYVMVGKKYEGNTARLIQSAAWRGVDLPTKLDCCAQILQGGMRLEELGILHLDQKPENIFYSMVFEQGKMKFQVVTADFGGATDSGAPETPTCSPPYMPFDEYQNGCTAKTDVYQRGVILFNFLTGRQWPWPIPNLRTNPAEAFPNHSKPENFNMKALTENHVPEPLCQLIREMCDPDPNKRPDSSTAYNRWMELMGGQEHLKAA